MSVGIIHILVCLRMFQQPSIFNCAEAGDVFNNIVQIDTVTPSICANSSRTTANQVWKSQHS